VEATSSNPLSPLLCGHVKKKEKDYNIHVKKIKGENLIKVIKGFKSIIININK
jgi:hypothetical protein